MSIIISNFVEVLNYESIQDKLTREEFEISTSARCWFHGFLFSQFEPGPLSVFSIVLCRQKILVLVSFNRRKFMIMLSIVT